MYEVVRDWQQLFLRKKGKKQPYFFYLNTFFHQEINFHSPSFFTQSFPFGESSLIDSLYFVLLRKVRVFKTPLLDSISFIRRLQCMHPFSLLRCSSSFACSQRGSVTLRVFFSPLNSQMCFHSLSLSSLFFPTLPDPFPLRRRYSCSPTSLPRVPTLVTFASIPFDALFKEIILHKSAAFLNWRTLMAIKIAQQVFRNERHTFVVGNCLNQRMINRREKQANYRSMLD